jgi:two-component system cell cycle response regulator PopA
LLSENARVLIVARDDQLTGAVAEGLNRLGWRTATARGSQSALAQLETGIQAAIVDVSEADAEILPLARTLKQAAAPRRLPVVALGRPDNLLEHWGFDLTLSPPLHPMQAAMRLEALLRAAIAEEEFELRQETFADRGVRLQAAAVDPAPFRVLTIGEPAPKFLALSHELGACGAEITAALTAYTAFDYLHERTFDAVVLWAGETHAEALSIAGGMRRNSKLYHTPTVLYLRDGVTVDPTDAYNRGLSDVTSADTPEAETARRVMSLAKAYRREVSIRQALENARSSGLMDPTTGLFTRDLFAAHLGRLATAARERRRPLSMAVLRIVDRPELAAARREGALDRAIPQLGSMIGRLVRAEDTAARLGPELFALALPAAHAAAAKAAADRITAVIACTAFTVAENHPPFTVDFEVGVAELGPDETAARALERAAAQALSRHDGP